MKRYYPPLVFHFGSLARSARRRRLRSADVIGRSPMHGLPPFGLPLLCRPDGGSFLVFRCTIGFVAMVFRCTPSFVSFLLFVAVGPKATASLRVCLGTASSGGSAALRVVTA